MATERTEKLNRRRAGRARPPHRIGCGDTKKSYAQLLAASPGVAPQTYALDLYPPAQQVDIAAQVREEYAGEVILAVDGTRVVA